MKNNYYYNIEDDIEAYPDAWAIIVVGGRKTGKTYGTLKSCYLNNIRFAFLKRTMDDVDLLCAGSGKVTGKVNEYGVDLSPFKAINRDIHSNVKAFSIRKGLGGFWKCDDTDTPDGAPIGYLLSLSAVSKFKGFDLSECDWMIFDEFIPQPWDKISKKEGEQLLDLYMTIARDREHRGKQPLKLICLANATSISNPVTNIFEVVDIMADMQVKHKSIYYDQDRGILIHIINDNASFQEEEKNTQVYKAMGNTAWGRMAFENEFAYNDFSNIGHVNLKGYRAIVGIKHKNNNYYIYMRDGFYYMTSSKNNQCKIYDLNLENDQKLFYTDYIIDLRNECIDGRMTFETYSMYDLIINYRKFFVI